MPRAMLLRVRRLETALRPRATATALAPRDQAARHDLMTRLAAHRDLFDEFAGIAERVQIKAIDQHIASRLLARLIARLGILETNN